MDFSLNKYEILCESIISSKYIPVTFRMYLNDISYNKKQVIIMRHDIDQNCKYALDVAKVEGKYGIKATYYFRTRRGTYVPNIIDEIASLGHEIGYHYETLDKGKGNIESASKLFVNELNEFRTRYDVQTVCAHGNPLTKFDNKDIWKSLKLSDFGLLGEAFLTLDYRQFAYFSDSGRTWIKNKSQKMSGKDDVVTAFDYIHAKSTNDIIQIIQKGEVPNICILTHPERWSKGVVSFTSRYFLDMAFSCGKVAIYVYRGIIKIS